MGTRRHAEDPHHSVEGIRAHEVRRLFNKLSLSPEQREAVENLSCTLVEKLVYGPIAETIALVQEPSESAAIGETSHARSGTSSRGAVASAL
jgi:Glutamyl-tRNAGlu reductase, dimerisation domain